MGPSLNDTMKDVCSKLRADLVYADISAKLLQEKIIDLEDHERIKSSETESAKIDKLMNILLHKNKEMFSKLAKILQTDYSWLSLELEKSTQKSTHENDTDIFQNSPFEKGITKEMMKIVQRNHRVANRWTLLAHSLGLTHCITDIRVKVNVNDEQHSMCIRYLLQEWIATCPHEANLRNLINTLREEKFNDVADQLESAYG